MKRIPALLLSVLFLLTLFPFFAAAKSGRLDADVAAKTRALDEMPARYLTDKVMRQATAFSDTALLVISRTSADGAHNLSYARKDVWGSYDVFGEKGGDAALCFPPAEIRAYGDAGSN